MVPIECGYVTMIMPRVREVHHRRGEGRSVQQEREGEVCGLSVLVRKRRGVRSLSSRYGSVVVTHE